MEKKRSFKQLKKEKNAEELRKFCRKMTEEYANSEAQFARSYFSEHYNISEKCFYEVIKYAIETNLVEDVVVFKAMEKATQNSEAHSKGSGGRCKANYEKMYIQKCKYEAMLIPTEGVRHAAIDFADNPNITKQDIAASYGWNLKMFEIILIRAIQDNIVDDATVEAIEKRSINNSKAGKKQIAVRFFLDLKKKREANKK